MHAPDARCPRESAPDDATVVARVLAGDKQQFAYLVERYQAMLYRHAVAMVLDHDEAADMVQDAFVRAYTQLRTCRDHARFRAWLFQLLRNRCLDHLKNVRRKNVSLDDVGDISDLADGPDTHLARVRLRDDIRVALASLPAAQREAFLMHHVEGVSYETMAELLDASMSALKMRVLRARGALSAALQNRKVTQASPARLSIRQVIRSKLEES
jgi:RNA polymerase sigma-70 factor, ECF subfamily